MSSIRLNTITVEESTLHIDQGQLYISDTTESINAHAGSIVLKGGMSINCTYDSTSSTHGGCLTIAGGLAVQSQTFLGDNFILDNTLSTFNVKGIDYPRMFLDDIHNQEFYISLDGMNQHFILNPNSLILNTTQDSINSSTGSLIISGGISINTTTNATSSTSGGAITINGGLSVAQDVYIGNNLYIGDTLNLTTLNVENISSIELNITSSSTYITGDDFYFNDVFSIIMKFPNDPYTIIQTHLLCYNDVHIGSTTNATGITDGSLTISGGVGIRGDIYIGGLLSINNSFLFNQNTSTSISVDSGTTGNSMMFYSDQFIFNNDLSIQGDLQLKTYTIKNTEGHLNIQSLFNTSNMNLFTSQGNQSNSLNIYAAGTPNSLVNTEYLTLGFSNDDNIFSLSILQNGTGELHDFSIQNTHGHITLLTNGSVHISNDLNLTSHVYVNNTDNATSFTNGGSFTILGGLSVLKDVYMGGDIHLSNQIINTPSTLYFQNGLDIRHVNSNESEVNNISLSLYTLGNDPSQTDFENLQLSNSGTTGYTIISNANGSGTLRTIDIHTGSHNYQLFLNTNGYIGVNNNNPLYTLDVDGTIYGDTIISENMNVTNTISCGTLIVDNFITHSDTTINSDLKMNAKLIVNDTTNATGLTNGSVVIYGGIGISKDVYINGMMISYTSGSFSDLEIRNTLLVNGPVFIDNTTNSTSTTDGGSLTISGGIGISGDLFLNGSSHLYNPINKNNVSDIIKIYDSWNILRFTFDYNNQDLSFSRYDTTDFIEHIITFSNTKGTVFFNNTTPSTSYDIASVILSGGLSIDCTQSASNVSNGGALTIAGGMSISGNSFFGDDVQIVSSTESNDSISGCLVLQGGLGIGGNLNVNGNTVINGNLTISGTTTSVDTITTTLTDNILVFNSGPTGSHDAGFIIQRYQHDNNTGDGDVVNDTPYRIDTIPTQAGILPNQIKLSEFTSNINNYYQNWWIKIQSGFSANQVRKITHYDGDTHIATLSSDWNTQNPGTSDLTYLYNKPFIGLIYNELLDVFEFGSTTSDPGNTYVTFTDTIGIACKSITLYDTTPSTNNSTGTLLIPGGLSISCTQDATSSTCGGGITVAGGLAVEKSLHVGNSIYVNNIEIKPNTYDIPSSVVYHPVNNSLDIPFLTIDNSVLSFDIFMGVMVQMSDNRENLYSNYHIRGVNKVFSWEIVIDYVGDDSGIEFDIILDNITHNGILRYSTPDYGINIEQITFKYKMTTN